MIKDLTNFKKAPKERRVKSYATGRLSKLEDDLSTSKSYHEAIIGAGMLEDNLKTEELEVVYEQINDIYLEYRAELVEAIEKSSPMIAALSDTGASPLSTAASSSHTGIRLPRIDLPKFDGSYTTWRAFQDRFQALVHNNKSIDDIDKLHFLQSCLIGDANRFLQNLSVEAANYDKAWELLKERYDHKRILVHIQMQKLFGQPSVSCETAAGLRDLLYTTRECCLALENMDVPVSKWDTVLIWFLNQKLPGTSQKLWEERLGNRKDFPNFKEFTDFLETRFRTLEVVGQQETRAAGRNKDEPLVNPRPRFQPAKAKVLHAKQVVKQPVKPIAKTVPVEQLLCKLCNQTKHTLRRCQRFLNMDIMGRKETSFKIQQQQPTTSNTSAQARNNRTNTEFQPMTGQQLQLNGYTLNYYTHGDRRQTHQVLLATAVVKARAADGKLRLLRALIDTGSETSFNTEAAAQLLKLEKRRTIAEVSGLGFVSSGITQHSVEVRFASRHSTFETAVQALVFKSLTGHLPTQRVTPGNWDHLKGLSLADPHLCEPAPIDLLLGSDVCAQIFLPEIRRPEVGIGPVAQKTELGWIVFGQVSPDSPRQVRSFAQIADLNSQLEKFRDIEETRAVPATSD
ncbi:uncharacterized protein LOC129944276 [Eupeodes corollae]|uniref:uncharacterized protein LOC129944276 n=1 Tax=Eupeodes corollae TaxID=290404 RepID=UPI0024936C23|nr:uncharacterized protein LOC129944276 [Eupeodes corollae]